MRKEQILIIIFTSFFVICIAMYSYAWFESNWRKSYRKTEQASDIVKYLIKNYTFASQSISNPNNPPVSTDFGRYPTIVVYTIVEPKEQDKVIRIVKQYMENNNIKTVSVKFYKSENWIEKKDSSGNVIGGMRGEERLIREITVKNKASK